MNQHGLLFLLLPHVFKSVENFFVCVIAPNSLSPKSVIKRFFLFPPAAILMLGQRNRSNTNMECSEAIYF